jgi:hypothetical protein
MATNSKMKNIQTIFLILKEVILLIKLLAEEWDKDEEQNGKDENPK